MTSWIVFTTFGSRRIFATPENVTSNATTTVSTM
jgi:hypothetical protein